jgi:hypothetical protein
MVSFLHFAGRIEIPEKYNSLSNFSDGYSWHLHSSSLESFHQYNWLSTQNKKPITQPNSKKAQFNPDNKFFFPFDSLQYYIITIKPLQRFLVVLLSSYMQMSGEYFKWPYKYSHIFSNSLFTSDPVIWHYVVWDMDSNVKSNIK